MATATEQAEQLREEGNLCFLKGRFGAAIDAYTGAITLCPNVPVYRTDRALCHRERNDWEKVEADCRKAISLDCNSVEAHYMLGLALLQMDKYAEGKKRLKEALDLGRGSGPKAYMLEEIWQELAKAKYTEWEHSSSSRSWELQNLKDSCESALMERNLLDSLEAGFSDEVAAAQSRQFESLEQVFQKAAEDDTPSEVPDYLCCKIGLDILRDPVIAPSGITYERAVILDHIEKVGYFDPTTRQPLNPSQLIPNLAIKEAVEAFLDKHGWAYKMD